MDANTSLYGFGFDFSVRVMSFLITVLSVSFTMVRVAHIINFSF